jgi:hypothetical protein
VAAEGKVRVMEIFAVRLPALGCIAWLDIFVRHSSIE